MAANKHQAVLNTLDRALPNELLSNQVLSF